MGSLARVAPGGCRFDPIMWETGKRTFLTSGETVLVLQHISSVANPVVMLASGEVGVVMLWRLLSMKSQKLTTPHGGS